MQILTGTSGFSYKGWKDAFYPEDLPQRKWLAFYAERLAAVEINNTFYRLPKAEVLRGWADQVPDGFRFAIKASRRITHQGRLKDIDDPLAYLLRTVETLGERRGPLLFQLPPYLRANRERLAGLLGQLPPGRAVLEFRHESWFEQSILDLLREHDMALCIAEHNEDDESDACDSSRVSTASWGYLRLRRQNYDDQQLTQWARWIEQQGWHTAYVMFKHDEAGVAPRLATRFARAVGPGAL